MGFAISKIEKIKSFESGGETERMAVHRRFSIIFF